MSDVKIFNSAAEALACQVECNIATLEHMRRVKRSSKADIRRAENIVRTGLRNCRLYVTPEDAHRARAHRVEEWMRGERTETGERPEEAA